MHNPDKMKEEKIDTAIRKRKELMAEIDIKGPALAEAVESDTASETQMIRHREIMEMLANMKTKRA